MSKIKSLKLSNFKFFGKEETINIDGKHLLLYGENGSGKSSVFWGLYTLLESSLKTAAETTKYFEPLTSSDESLVNIYADQMSSIPHKKEHHNSYLEVEDNNSTKYLLSLLDNDICGNSDAMESRKATDFINYQALFKFQEFKNSEVSDLYDVFCYSILPYVTFGMFTLKGKMLSNAYDMWKEYQSGPGTTINTKGDTIQVYKHSQDYTNFLNFEIHFDNELASLIDFINEGALEMMRKFGYNIKFKLEYIKANHKKLDKNYESTPFQITLHIIQYNDQQIVIKKPHSFLNEAKMAAIATAIRFLALDYKVSTATPNALKVLVLDDIMISLDMSNRDQLMELLLSEYANKYQILFLTHDKSLYNFVDHKIRQHNQNSSWLRKEMYIGEEESSKQEYPVIIDGECTPLEKAKRFYNSKDFATSAIYVRQSFEKALANALPEELKRKPNNQFVSLEDLWKMFKERYKLDDGIIAIFEQAKRVLLNPSAHYQKISQPIYRRELNEAFLLLSELEKLNLSFDTLLIEKGYRMVFKHPSENYTFEFELKSDMVRRKGMDTDPKCKILTWQYNGVEFYDFNTGSPNQDYLSSSPKFSRLKSNLFNLTITPTIDEACFLDNTTIEKGTLREALM